MSNPEFHECPNCGYKWQHGRDGSHSCVQRMVKTIEQLNQQVLELSAQVEVMRGGMNELISAGNMLLRKEPPDTVMEAERQLDVIRNGVLACKQYLTITPSAAILAHDNEVAAKALEEAAEAREEGRKEAVPDGCQVVPKEPTSAMIQVGRAQFYHTPEAHWKAMLAAAPSPTSLKEGGE